MAALDAGCVSAGCALTRRQQWCTYALVKGRTSSENDVTPLFVSFCFLSLSSLSSSSFLSLLLLPQVFPFLQLNTINDLFHLHLIRTLCLHLGYSTPLPKTLTVNHYLHIQYFQHQICRDPRVISDDCPICVEFSRHAYKLIWVERGPNVLIDGEPTAIPCDMLSYKLLGEVG